MDHSKNHNQHLGVNKLGKNIRKSPLHQPSFTANARPSQHQQQQQQPPPPQPQVYNISKNDFRSMVQQLTGTPSRDPPAGNNPPPPSNPHPFPRPPHLKAPSMRLQKIRPPPLTPIARHPPPALAPQIPYQNPHPAPVPVPVPNPINNPAFFPRPVPSPTGACRAWADSPVTAYMRYLESSISSDTSSRQPQPQAQPPLLPSPPLPTFPSPRANAAPPALLPSPGSQFVVPSPSAFLNMLSPKSPYPLLSPGFQYPPLLTPNFAFSPGPGMQPPSSPGLFFPQSPSGFFSILSPRWRNI